MTYEEYVASYADAAWMYTAAGNIAYAGRIYDISVERTAYNLCYVTYTAEMVTKGGDNAYYFCGYNEYSNIDNITGYQWHGQIENGYFYRNTFRHSFYLDSVTQASKSLSFKLGMQDVSGNQAWSGNFSKTVTVPSWTSYTVAYNANGGSGAPASQTKYKDVALTLQSGIPTRTGYQFTGWNTSADGSGTSYASGGTYTANAGATLYAQWKALASVLTTPISVTAGSAATISWTRYSTAYKHTLEYSIGSASGTIVSNLVAASTSWTPPLSLCNQVTNAASGTGKLTLKTYNGTTLLGTSEVTFTLNVPSSVVPSFSYVLSEGQASGFNVYATTLSKLRAVLTTAGSYGSTVSSASMTVDGKTYTASVSNNTATLTSEVLSTAGSVTVTLTITDSRGRTATQTATITAYEYFAPQITGLEVDINGTTVTATVTGSIASVNSLNTKYLTIKKIRISDEEESTVMSRTALSSYTVNQTVTETVSDIDTETYKYTAYLEDTKYTGSNAITKELVTGIVCISRYAGGKGVSFFGEADQEGFVTWNGGTKIDRTISSSDWSSLTTWYNNN